MLRILGTLLLILIFQYVPVSLNYIPSPEEVLWSSGGHTGVNVPLYAWGDNAELFDIGTLDNTDIYQIIIENY